MIMIGYILTTEQKNAIQGQAFAPFEQFNCVQDVDGVWYTIVSPKQIPVIQSGEFAWVTECPESEYVPPTPPSL